MSANPVVDAVVSTVQCATSGCDPVTYSMTVLPGPSPVTISNAADDLADAVNTIDNLPDNALVCRGGTCIAERFETGAGVTLNADGTMTGVSVNSASGASLDELTVTIPNGQVGVTTVGDVRLAGGNVIPDPLLDNPYHSLLNGITSTQAEKLLTPTIPNPHRLRGR